MTEQEARAIVRKIINDKLSGFLVDYERRVTLQETIARALQEAWQNAWWRSSLCCG